MFNRRAESPVASPTGERDEDIIGEAATRLR